MYTPNKIRATAAELERGLSEEVTKNGYFKTPGGEFYYFESPMYPGLTIGRLEIIVFRGHKIPSTLQSLCREIISDFLLTPCKVKELAGILPPLCIDTIYYYMTPISKYVSAYVDKRISVLLWGMIDGYQGYGWRHRGIKHFYVYQRQVIQSSFKAKVNNVVMKVINKENALCSSL